jgi:hypothetical protein
MKCLHSELVQVSHLQPAVAVWIGAREAAARDLMMDLPSAVLLPETLAALVTSVGNMPRGRLPLPPYRIGDRTVTWRSRVAI